MNSAPNEQSRLLVERVVESRYFSKSTRLRDMLLYLAGRVLRDGATEIHEQEVGHRVFGREPDYDTVSDNTVRVHASTLRKRLEQFFAAEGASEPVIIELPKGNYAPVFRSRSAAAEPEEVDSVGGPVPASTSSTSRTRWLPWAVSGTSCLIAAGALWWALSRPAPAGAGLLAGKPAVSQFWAGVFRAGQPTDLVLDDAVIGLYQELTGHEIGLSDYYDRGYLRGLNPSGPESKLGPEIAEQLVLKRQSSFAHINALWRFGQLTAASQTVTRVIFARDYNFQALKSNNAILFGSSRTNPWAEPFEAAAGFRWQFDPAVNGYYPVDTRAPAAEKDRYRAAGEKREGQDSYALVILEPNPRGNGRVLLLSGTGGSALGILGEFLTDEASVRRLRSRLPSSGARDETFPFFEALLKIQSRNRRPEDVQLAVCRLVTARPGEPE